MGDPLGHVWAKSPEKGKKAGESLLGHTENVLGRLAGWRDRYRDLPAHTDREDLWDLAAWACLLHDVGKVALGFQRMLRGGPAYPHRHEVLSLVAVGWLDVPDADRALVAAGVATHHRDLDQVLGLYPPQSQDVAELLDDLSAADEAALRGWLNGEGPDPRRLAFAPLPPLRPSLKAEAFFASMQALERLQESLQRADATSRPLLAVRAMRGLVILADHAASAHERLSRAPVLETRARLLDKLAEKLAGDLLPHQRACAQAQGHALLIAPTGSGKTEAALLWAAHQREIHPGRAPLFYVLPYRASLNAMRIRLEEKYGVSPAAVVLQHASATSALYSFLLEKSYAPDVAARVARHEKNLAALMTAPVRVLTPYQLLRGFFGLRGHEAVLTDAAGGLFIFDELHAYDVPRLALILAGLQHLVRDLGARVLAMSATFPAVLKHVLAEVIGAPLREIVADAATRVAFRRHRLRIAARDLLSDETVEAIARCFLAGQAVLVVATTVARAQAIFRPLHARFGQDAVSLLHSRFTTRDRNKKEQTLAFRVGTGRREKDAPGTILVATQVVEVSLDVDFDVLFTDPAPVEALIQRFGRVNRGRRGEPFDVFVHAVVPPEGDWIYPRPDVDRAIEILAPHADRVIDEDDVQGWVDAAYASRAVQWRADVLRQIQDKRDAVIRVNRPLSSHDDLKEQFEAMFDGCEVVPECLRPDYEHAAKHNPLDAASFRVPLSTRQRARLLRAGRLRGEFVGCPYDSMFGLDLSPH